MTIKSHLIIRGVNGWYLIINKINRYIEESDGNKLLTLFPTSKSKETLKNYEKLWNKI